MVGLGLAYVKGSKSLQASWYSGYRLLWGVLLGSALYLETLLGSPFSRRYRPGSVSVGWGDYVCGVPVCSLRLGG